MPKITISERARGKAASRDYSFTVVFEPLARVGVTNVDKRRTGTTEKPPSRGYQVTVPLLPGLITYGRTLSEAREMARDAIRCHLEGLQKDGEPIPNEASAIKEKLRVAISA